MAFNWELFINYILCFLFGMLPLFVFMRNYLTTWMKVKLPLFSNADIQVRVKNPVKDYFAVGSFNNGCLNYRAKPRPDNRRPDRIINVNNADYNRAVYRSNGVPCIDVDDVKNCVLIWNGIEYSACPGFNAEAMDEVVKTAQNKPDPNGSKMTWQDWVMIGGFLILGVASYMIIKKADTIDAHLKTIYDLVSPMYQSMNITQIVPAVVG